MKKRISIPFFIFYSLILALVALMFSPGHNGEARVTIIVFIIGFLIVKYILKNLNQGGKLWLK